jgi:hypothetical protein
MYAYCENNPSSRKDETGKWVNILVGAVVGALVGAATSLTVQFLSGEKIDGSKIIRSAVVGCLSGALAATGVPVIGQQIGNAVINMADNAISQIMKNKGTDNFDFGSLAFDGAMGWFAGKAGGDGFEVNVDIKTLGKNLTKKLATGDRDIIIKGLSYYYKSTHTFYYRSLVTPIVNAAKVSFTWGLVAESVVNVK